MARAIVARTNGATKARLWLDATYIKVRRSGRIVSVAAIVAVAVNLDGRREVLEQNDEWAVTRRYMTLETVAAICGDTTMDPAKIAAL